jgi:hypothetical protein
MRVNSFGYISYLSRFSSHFGYYLALCLLVEGEAGDRSVCVNTTTSILHEKKTIPRPRGVDPKCLCNEASEQQSKGEGHLVW